MGACRISIKMILEARVVSLSAINVERIIVWFINLLLKNVRAGPNLIFLTLEDNINKEKNKGIIQAVLTAQQIKKRLLIYVNTVSLKFQESMTIFVYSANSNFDYYYLLSYLNKSINQSMHFKQQ